MFSKRKLFIFPAIASGLAPGAVMAQSETILIQPAIPFDYSRGRNVSVLEKNRPDYDPLGIRSGSIDFFPQVTTSTGVSDNIFLTDANTVTDISFGISPSLRFDSDWSRHAIRGSAGARFRRYVSNSLRDEDEYYANILGRADIGSTVSITAEAQAARVQEEPFSGSTADNISVLSRYNRALGGLRAQYARDRTRLTLAYDYSAYRFSPVEQGGGLRFSQLDRNRDLHRVTAQAEYAVSPSFSLYGQFGYVRTGYQYDLAPGVKNRDSNGIRVIAGINADLTQFLRGSVGVGYINRNYDSSAFRNIRGVSVEAKVEYFPTELTTFTLGARRTIEDASITGVNAFFDNRLSLRADHELRRNVLLNAGLEVGRQDYVDSTRKNTIWRLRAGGQYLMSRKARVQMNVSYGIRDRTGTANNSNLNEARGLLSFTYSL